MKRILVTGSNGLLGQKLTERVLKFHDFDLIATSKGTNRYPITTGYTYAEMDILDSGSVKEVIEEYKPDAIIHTAAMTNVDTCEENKAIAFALNVGAVQTLISVCELHNIQLIHLSTDFIFDGADGPYSEEGIPKPLSYYGETKLQAENLLKNSNVHWVILRTILVYGIVSDMSRSNIVLWAKNALEKGAPLNVVNDQWRMPTLAEDLAEICLLAVQKSAQGIYNASGKDMMSISELVAKVADYWKLDKSLINEVSGATLNQKARRPARTGFDLSKSILHLGYQPHSFQEGLELLDSQIHSA
ncbi:MAG: NAD(P)-dependent oxidoreductase [Pedobacter sp.]|jgi:dTDP-4-dehydrorhamnose reductase|nr:NAD(P)-dependent oxidoreductase [Pedobacter sp.]